MHTAHFYLLEDDSLKTYTRYVCRLVDQLYSQRKTLYLYCENLEIAQRFDEDLWTFRDISFIPHGLVTDQTVLEVKLPSCIIGFPDADHPSPLGEVLLNLTETIPKFFKEYPQLVELVPADQKLRAASRERYKQYQQGGYRITTHKDNSI